MKDTFGDRMKAYEAVEAKRRLDISTPIIARIDGRTFSKFTKSFERPFDERMSNAMAHATSELVEETRADIGYTQSDEITLIWSVDRSNPATTMWFDARVQKLSSVLAGFTTAKFMQGLSREMGVSEWQWIISKSPHFDCRIWNVPDENEAANTLLWRAQDCLKNSISMFSRCYLSAKEMHGLSGPAQIKAAAEKGSPDFGSVPSAYRYGRFFQRVTELRTLTVNELNRIPVKHRPSNDEKVRRSRIKEFTSDITKCEDLRGLIFNKEG